MLRMKLIPLTVSALLTGPAMAADYEWSTGEFASTGIPSVLMSGDVLDIVPGTEKGFVGDSLTSSGLITATDDLYFALGGTLTNEGVYQFGADVGLYGGNYGGVFNNYGTLQKTSGSGNSVIGTSGPGGSNGYGSGNVNFTNESGGIIEADSGTIDFAGGQATFDSGSVFTGAGVVNISNNASFNGTFTSSNLVLSGGTLTGTNAELAGSTGQPHSVVDWTGGTLNGNWTVDAGQIINIQSGTPKLLTSASVTNNGTLNASDDVYLTNGGTITNTSAYKILGDVGIYGGYYGGTVVNTGTFEKSSGTGTTVIGNDGPANIGSGTLTFTNNGGTIKADSGTINFSTGSANFNTGSVFTGAGTINVSNNASFNGTFTSGNLVLSGGTFTGTNAELAASTSQPNSVVQWTGGTLNGNWTVDAGQTINIQSGTPKLLTSASVTNNGTLNASDDVYLTNGGTITNNSAYKIQGDVGIYGGDYGGTVVNTGTFEKSSGTGTTLIGNDGPANVGSGTLTFTNNGGTIKADSGTINFSTGSANFNTGTVFTGAGTINVSNNANFNGTFTSSNLVLSGGTFTGSNAELAGSTAQPKSVVDWTGGTLNGNWTVDANQTVNLQTGTGKAIDGASLANAGTINATDDLTLAHGGSLTNTGVYNAEGGVSVLGGAYGGSFANEGTFTKTGAGTTTDLSSVAFTNTASGSVQVQSGTVQLANGFDNQGQINVSTAAALTIAGGGGAFTSEGTLLGSGTINGSLTNNGHVAPGASASAPGTLTIAGNYSQSSTGFLDIGASGSTNGLLAVSGTATLGGTIDVNCVGTCTYAKGSEFLILSSSGLTVDPTTVDQSGFTGINDFSLKTIGNDEYLVLNNSVTAAVPEPSTYILVIAGLSVLTMVRRRYFVVLDARRGGAGGRGK